MSMRIFYIVLVLVIIPCLTKAEEKDIPASQDDSNTLHLRINSSLFFINNEYFGEIVEGYTYPGYIFEPTLIYKLKPSLRFSGGLNLRDYYGSQRNPEITPVLSAEMDLTPDMTLIMGSIRGHRHHKLSDPMFHIERQYTDPVENGFQFILDSKKFWMDAWINWQQFIFPGDTIPEIFTAGISSRFNLLNLESKWQIEIPFQFLAHHVGGQINDYSESMQSILNSSIGLEINKSLSGKLKSAGLFFHFLNYNDLQDAHQSGVDKGNAINTGITLNTKNSRLTLGYWNAHNFISPMGNVIYQSVSTASPGLIIPDRSLLTGKIELNRTYSRHTHLSFYFEGFYDLPASHFDYGYGLQLLFSPTFFIAKIR
jgi:hypothetical protein